VRPSESVFFRGICRKLVEGMFPHTRSTFLPISLSCRPPPRSVHTPFHTLSSPQRELGASGGARRLLECNRDRGIIP
jgi:hypothetical protein